jgi:hypothetical protein
MAKFINLTFLDSGSNVRGLIINTSKISSYRENDTNASNTLITISDNTIESSLVLNCIITISAFEALIAAATDSPNEFIQINCGNPIGPDFFEYKISVNNLTAVGFCIITGFSAYNQLYIPSIPIFMCTSESLTTIYTKIYA